MSDALVARLTRTAGDLAAAGPEGAVIRGDKTLAFATDISDLLTAYATVQAEQDAARADVQRLIEQNDETTREWGEDVTRLRAELATLRETLVGEVERMQRWDRVDIDDIEWNIVHDPEGEYLYRSDVLRRLRGAP